MTRKNAPFLPDPVTGSLIGLCPIIVVTGNFGAGVMMAVGFVLFFLVLHLMRGLTILHARYAEATLVKT